MSVLNLSKPYDLNNLWIGSMNGAVQILLDMIQNSRPRYHCSVNALALYWMRHHPQFREALANADVTTADGASILLAQGLWSTQFNERIPGIDLATNLLMHAHAQQWGVVFISTRELILERLKSRLSSLYPGLKISTERYTEDDTKVQQMGQRIKSRHDKIAFLGASMPHQEIWMSRHKNTLGVPLLMGIGGGIEVLAAVQQRAPEAWRRHNLEWLYRFLREPKRRFLATWRSTGHFACLCLTWKLGKIINK